MAKKVLVTDGEANRTFGREVCRATNGKGFGILDVTTFSMKGDVYGSSAVRLQTLRSISNCRKSNDKILETEKDACTQEVQENQKVMSSRLRRRLLTLYR